MKAVILAGGRGERLRPITDSRPKPLVPVLARPVMDYCLSLLAHHGVTRGYVTTHYLADQIRHRYGKEAFGMTLSYHLENCPMGTCGGVKLLEKELASEELFLVMSGDALCDFDLSEAIRFHREKGADVTVILSSVKTPLEYGVVLRDTLDRIFAFSEKPDWSETLSDLANTGVYILSPRVLAKIPAGKSFDFAKDLFPLLLREGYSLYGYKDRGYWCDIGKIPTLYRCNMDVLQGKAKTYLEPEGKTFRSRDGEGCYFISNSAVVENGADIRQNTIVSPGAFLAEGSRASGAIIMEKVELKKGASVKDAILCENCRIGEDAHLPPNTVLGAGSVAEPSSTAQAGKKYPAGTVLTRKAPFCEEGMVFTEQGAARGGFPGLDREDAQKLGFSLARLGGERIGILWDEAVQESAHYATALAGGVTLGGASALMLDRGTEEMASFAANLLSTPVVFVSVQGDLGVFYAFGKDGIPFLRKEVLRLSRFAEEELPRKATGDVIYRGDIRDRYLRSLERNMGQGAGRRVGFSGRFSQLLREAAINAGFAAYNGSRGKGLSLEVFHGEVKLFLDGQRFADTEKLRLYLLDWELERGRRRFALPQSAPHLFAEHIMARGGTAERFSMRPTLREEGNSRMLASHDRWLYDNAHLAARVLSRFALLGEAGLARELKKTPDIYITSLRYEPKEDNKAKLLSVSGELAHRGKKVRLESGFYGMKIISEATAFEAALDNAFEYRGKLNEIEEKLGRG